MSAKSHEPLSYFPPIGFGIRSGHEVDKHEERSKAYINTKCETLHPLIQGSGY